MGRMFILIVVALMVTVASSFATKTVTVDWTGAGDYTTISEGIAAVETGDTVLVAPGTYSGEGNRNLLFYGKEITVMSTGGCDATFIDAENLGRGFMLTLSEGPGTVLSGFTIMNGTAAYGAGIFCDSSSPTITDCHIWGCIATQSNTGGGGIMCRDGGAPTLTDVTFTACRGDYGAALMAYYGSTPSLTRVRFESNMADARGGGCNIELTDGTVTITDCVFIGNSVISGYGGGLFLFSASPIITGTTFAYNRASNGGCITLATTASPTIENSILSFSRDSKAVYRYSENEVPTITQCVVYGNDDGDDLVGNYSDILNVDPRFCDMPAGDLTLCSNSECVLANNPWGVQVGAHGDGACGECDAPVNAMSWGGIKSLYR
ncbi:right-handed parallel beta-helix repeat-containing protein [bacterium]|nr:right-handed parallel beta-helix repeat-containing protein [bacterium]